MFFLEKQWGFLRVCTISLVGILHIPLVTLSILALVQGSGGAVQIIIVILDAFIFIVISMYILAKALYLKGQANRTVDVLTFGGLGSFSFVLWILLLSRVQPVGTGRSLVDDYASIGGSNAYVGNLVSCLATFGLLFSSLGLATVLIDDYEHLAVGDKKRRLFRPPLGLSSSIPSLRPSSPELEWDEQTRKAYLPDGTATKLETAPAHVDICNTCNRGCKM